MRVVIDETFNKSVCLDLESHLIRWLSGDGQYRVLNRNSGIVDADYYDRVAYRHTAAITGALSVGLSPPSPSPVPTPVR
jgi:hypothetical protein